MKSIQFSLKIFLVIAAITTVGCKKYLDQQPITELSTNTVFSDEKSAYSALVSVYSRLTGDQGYGIRLSLYYTVDNDETQGPSGTEDGDRRSMARYTLTSSNAQLEKPFNQLFQGIDYANICIDQIPKMDLYTSGTEQQKKRLQRMYGEALTLRAQFYFEAIIIWGDLPANFEPAYKLASVNPFPTRVNRDTLYNQIIADLATASSLVPWQNEVASIGDPVDERITKATCKALRARIALFAGGYSLRDDGSGKGEMKHSGNYISYYQIARQESADIIANGQHRLNPNYKNLWKDQVGNHAIVDPDGELLFQVTGIGNTATADTKLGYYNGPTIGVTGNVGNKSITILPSYFYSFDPADTRRDVTCAPYNVAADVITKAGTAITAINEAKWRRDWNKLAAPANTQYFGSKWQIIRYADVLLMFAEAENELNGPTGLAYNAINQVRRRGFGKPINTPDPTVDLAGLTKSDFFDAIVKERSFEFGGEGIRKFDLIRWNLLSAKIAESVQKMNAMVAKTSPYDVLPTNMYYYNNATGDDKSIWANSLYSYAPFTDPSVTYNVQTVNTTIASNDYGVNTKGQTITITLPSAVANAGKIYWVKYSPSNAAATITAAWSYNFTTNTINGEKIDGTATKNTYSGSVAATNPATTSGSSKIIGFYSDGTGWVSTTSVSWVGTSSINTTNIARYATGFVTGKSELFPIPQTAITANPNLKQNPGY